MIIIINDWSSQNEVFVVESLITGGLFVKSALPQSLVKTVRVAPNSSLVLVDSLGSMKIASLAERVNANRLLVPVAGDTPLVLQREAERLTLAGENIYVQIPAMCNGQLNRRLIQQLTSEGIPLAITGIVTRQMTSQLLDGLQPAAPVILMMAAATSYYDLIVSAALAQLFPEVQLVATANNINDLCMVKHLSLDGVVVDTELLPFFRRPIQGMTCRLADHEVQMAR